MGYAERRQRAQFRDVVFYVEAIEREGGRRKQVTKFPNRSDVHVDDFGLDSREFNVSAYVIGDDYDLAIAALESALEEPGPGRLVHPWRGSMVVEVLGRPKTTEAKATQGKAPISFRVIRVDETSIAFFREDTREALRLAGAAATEAANEGFLETFDVDALPSGFLTSAQDAVSELLEVAAEVEDAVTASLSTVSRIADIATSIEEQTLDALVTTPLDLSAQLAATVGAVLDAAVNATSRTQNRAADSLELARRTADAFRALGDLFAFGDDLPAIPGNTPHRQQERANRDAIVRSVRVNAAIGACTLSLTAVFGSRSQAVGTRRDLYDVIDGLLVDPGLTDGLFGALEGLRAQMHQHLSSVASTLPEVREHELARALPIQVVAQHLYGDATRADELLARNPVITNPNFVPERTALEVATE